MGSKKLTKIQNEIAQINQRAKALKVNQSNFNKLVVQPVEQITVVKTMVNGLMNEIEDSYKKHFGSDCKAGISIMPRPNNKGENKTPNEETIFDLANKDLTKIYPKLDPGVINALKNIRKNLNTYIKKRHFPSLNSNINKLNEDKKELVSEIIQYIDYLIEKYSSFGRMIAKVIKTKCNGNPDMSWAMVKKLAIDFNKISIVIHDS